MDSISIENNENLLRLKINEVLRYQTVFFFNQNFKWLCILLDPDTAYVRGNWLILNAKWTVYNQSKECFYKKLFFYFFLFFYIIDLKLRSYKKYFLTDAGKERVSKLEWIVVRKIFSPKSQPYKRNLRLYGLCTLFFYTVSLVYWPRIDAWKYECFKCF